MSNQYLSLQTPSLWHILQQPEQTKVEILFCLKYWLGLALSTIIQRFRQLIRICDFRESLESRSIGVVIFIHSTVTEHYCFLPGPEEVKLKMFLLAVLPKP